jgi:light-regulated signal transduction histidine kinase (bacteriophytochrome)
VDTTIVPFLDESGKPRQHVSIRTEISKLKNIEAEVRKLNSELEQRVAERTADLQAANKELEAFSYSVSHDLRAPLRAVSGFTAILKEDHSAQLSEEARQLIERIHAGGQQMSRLINDLLKFSRLSRQALNRQDVNMASLVKSVWQEMEAEHKPREIEVRIGDLPPCSGDPALLKQVWANLISNAIKFTRGRDPAILEIGCNRNNGEVIYHICDNGAGFDMEHAGKLFDVFQRLHRPDEFEGSGVGLAIVQRIIHRHGGRVWAEAEVDRGATFHLTIGQKPVN